jgi:hypothetical protein
VARGLNALIARSPERYQSNHVFGEAFSNLPFAQGSNRESMTSVIVGPVFLSPSHTSPFTSHVRRPDSIWRSTLSFPCLVDSRINLPFHINLYQYVSPRLYVMVPSRKLCSRWEPLQARSV